MHQIVLLTVQIFLIKPFPIGALGRDCGFCRLQLAQWEMSGRWGGGEEQRVEDERKQSATVREIEWIGMVIIE